MKKILALLLTLVLTLSLAACGSKDPAPSAPADGGAPADGAASSPARA